MPPSPKPAAAVAYELRAASALAASAAKSCANAAGTIHVSARPAITADECGSRPVISSPKNPGNAATATVDGTATRSIAAA